MSLFLILAVLILYRMFRLFQDLSRGYSSNQKQIGLVRFPLLGNLPQLLFNYHGLYEYLLDQTKRFNEMGYRTWQMTMPGTVMFVTDDPKNLEHAMKSNFGNYVRSAGNIRPAFIELLGNGIFNADGSHWHSQRKLSAQIFSVTQFRTFMLDTFHAESIKLLEIMKKAALDETWVDIHELFLRLTMASFGKIAFGLDLGVLENYWEEKSQQDLNIPPWDARYAPATRFVKCFDLANSIVDSRLVNSLWQWTQYFDGSRYRFNIYMKHINAFAYDVIEKRRADPARDSYSDLLSRFMNVKVTEEDGTTRPYTDEELRDMIINMIIAGRDTTAEALAWTLTQLNSDNVALIREEISTVLPAHTHGTFEDRLGCSYTSEPNYDFLTRDMKYTKAVMYETLRLFPSVPKQGKIAIEKDVLPDGTTIPAGSMLVFSSWVMGRLESLWGPTASDFDPERFLNNEDAPEESAWKFMAFNAGPRLCLGQAMAWLEYGVVLSKILNEFDIVCLDKNARYANAVTLFMREGLKVRIYPRGTVKL